MSLEQPGNPIFEPVNNMPEDNIEKPNNRVITLKEEGVNLLINLRNRIEAQNSKRIELSNMLALMISAKKISTREFALLWKNFEEADSDYNENKALLKELREKTELDIEPMI